MKRAWLRGSVWGVAAVVSGVSSCSSLPDIDRGVCGNGVVEPDHNEDCDNAVTDDAGRAVCFPAGTPAACHYDCSTEACPAGFACGADAVCRKPKGIFAEAGHGTQVDADRLLVGDFDQDGLGDVVAQTNVEMNVLFGDTSSELTAPFTIRAPNSNPALGQLALDPAGGASELNSDVVFTASFGVTTWRGRADRTLAPTPYPSLEIGKEEARVMQMRVLEITDDVLVFSPINEVTPGAKGSFISEIGADQTPDTASVFAFFANDDQAPSALVGDVPVAQFIDTPTSPCAEFALAFSSATQNGQVTVMTTCSDASTLNTFELASGGSAPIPPTVVHLPPGVVIRSGGAGVHAGDVNGDGHVDLIVDVLAPNSLVDGGTQQADATFVAYSLGNGNFSSSPTLAPADNTASLLLPIGPVLAIGQLTAPADELFDFVLPTTIVLQVPSAAPDAGPDGGVGSLIEIAADQAWTDARIGDVDGDMLPDVIAGSTGRVDVYKASGTELLTHIPFAVDGNAGEFALGDFDGDRAPDIAFRADHGDQTGDLDVMWGKFLGVPENPVVVGRFGDIRTIGSGVISGNIGDNDAVSDLGVVVKAGDGSFSVSVLAGATNRQLQAPFFIEQPTAARVTRDFGLPFAYSIGQFTAGDRHPDLAAGIAVSRTGLGSATTSLDMELVVAQATGAAALNPDPTTLLFTDKFDSFTSFTTTCATPPCNLPLADWSHMSMAAVDLDAPSDNAIDEIIGIAPALATGDAFHDASAEGAFFWARQNGSAWQIQSLAPRGSLPANRAPIASLATADLNGDGALDILALSDGAKGTTLVAYINQKNGQLPIASTLIALPSYSTDPGAPFHIVSVAPIDADSSPGKEVALLTDAGGLFLAKSDAAGDSFTVTGPLCNGTDLNDCANNARSRIPSGSAIAAVDVDGDGVQDLVIESNLTLHVFRGVAVDP